MTRISPDVTIDNLRRLAVAVVMQAVRDARSESVEEQLDAALWLCGEDVAFWLEWADMPFADSLSLLVSGRLRGKNE